MKRGEGGAQPFLLVEKIEGRWEKQEAEHVLPQEPFRVLESGQLPSNLRESNADHFLRLVVDVLPDETQFQSNTGEGPEVSGLPGLKVNTSRFGSFLHGMAPFWPDRGLRM